MNTRLNFRSRLLRSLAALSLTASALSGCYVIPVGPGPDGAQHYLYSPLPVVPAPVNATTYTAPPMATGGTAFPATLPVRLYPANDIANQHGVLNGSVTNMMTGKGRFQFNYEGDNLIGEATRVSGEERRGVASAHGAGGTYASCEYQMSTPRQGAGTCTFSDGARYQVHIGG
jgi:hypothetical protein